jgi:hypothetical protein
MTEFQPGETVIDPMGVDAALLSLCRADRARRRCGEPSLDI